MTKNCRSSTQEQIDAFRESKRLRSGSFPSSSSASAQAPQASAPEQHQPTLPPKAGSKKSKKCMYFTTFHPVVAIVSVKCDKKIIFITKVNLPNHELKLCRIWVDTGSEISLLSAHSPLYSKLQRLKLSTSLIAIGLGGQEKLQEEVVVEIFVNDAIVSINCFVSTSTVLFSDKIDILLGVDVIGKQLGLSIPPGLKPHLYLAQTDKDKVTEGFQRSVEGSDVLIDKGDGVNQPQLRDRSTVYFINEGGGVPLAPNSLEVRHCPTDVTVRRDGVKKVSENSEKGSSETSTNIRIEGPSENSHLTLITPVQSNKKQIRKADKLHRQDLRRKRNVRLRYVLDLIKNVERYEITPEDLKAFVDRYPKPRSLNSKIQQANKIAEIHRKDKETKKELQSSQLFIPRKRRRKATQNSTQVALAVLNAVVDPSQVTTELATLQDPPDREETFVYCQVTDEVREQINQLTDEFNDVLVPDHIPIPMGQMLVEPFDIDLIEGGEQHLMDHKPKPFPARGPKKDLIQKSFLEIEANGGGTNNEAGIQFASPCFLATRPRSTKVRVCTAYNVLNSQTKNEIFAMPSMEDIIARLKGCAVFSIIDLRYAYNQVPLTERAQTLGGVLHSGGTFKMKVLNFGFKNAPAHFQRVILQLLRENPDTELFCLVYIDDIVIFSRSIPEHLIHLRQVLIQLRKGKGMAHLSKVHLFLAQLKLLGKIVNGFGVSADPSLTEDILKFPRPKTATHVKSFMGLMNSFHNFIPGLQVIAEPLFRLTHKNIEFTWNAEQQIAFDTLKKAVLDSKVLVHFDWTKDLRVELDASILGAGAVLLQMMEDDFWHPVAFASWLFNQAQRKYSTTDRELLAILLFCRKFRYYLFNRKVDVYSDHAAIPGYLQKDPHGRLARWFSELHQFTLTLHHIKGIENVTADVMSRVWEFFSEQELTTLTDKMEFKITDSNPFMENQLHKVVAAFTFNTKATIEAPCNYALSKDAIIMGIQAHFSLPSDEDLAKYQRKDPVLLPQIKWLEEGTLPIDDSIATRIVIQGEHLVLSGPHNMLCKLITRKDETSPSARRIVPQSLMKLICASYHDTIWMGAHLGRDKTIDKIKRTYFWEGMDQFIDNYCKNCLSCLQHKNPVAWSKAKLGVIETDAPWDLVCIDLVGPFPTSDRSNKFILTVICGFSKFAFAIGIPSKAGSLIAKVLWERVFSILGMPKRLHSDRGREFVNKILKALCETLNIRQSMTTAYHPQGNAFAERIHKFFRNAIAAYVNQDHSDWDEILISVLLAYNDAIHTALGCSPAEVMFGRHLNLPGFPLTDTSKGYNPKQWHDKLKWVLAKTQEIIMEKIEEKKDRNTSLSSNIQTAKFEIGQKVRLFNPTKIEGKKAKLLPRWYGPYTIFDIKSQGKVIYLEDSDGIKEPLPYSVNRIDLWPEDNTPTLEGQGGDVPEVMDLIPEQQQKPDSPESSEEEDEEEPETDSEDEGQPVHVIPGPELLDEPYIPPKDTPPIVPRLEKVELRKNRRKTDTVAKKNNFVTNMYRRDISTRYNFVRRHPANKRT